MAEGRAVQPVPGRGAGRHVPVPTVLAVNLLATACATCWTKVGQAMSTGRSRIENLQVALPAGGDRTHAVNGVSLPSSRQDAVRGRRIGLRQVGDGDHGDGAAAAKCGRPAAAHAAEGRAAAAGRPGALRALRGQAMGMVFQEPMTALNPVMACGDQVDELLRTHTDWPASQRRAEILADVLNASAARARAHLPQLSAPALGRQRQRIVIAMAVILKPVRC